MSNPASMPTRKNQTRTAVLFVMGLIVFEAFLIYGLQTDHFWETLSNGAMICLSCIGVG
jgi:hypothetical protein